MNEVEQLENFLNENIDEAVKNPVPFMVDTTEKAIWAMRKIATIDRSIEEVNKAADAEVDRVNVWRAEEVKRISSQRGFFEGLLEGYHRRVMAENPKKKTIKLPHGQLQIRAQKPEFEKDEKVLLDWAKVNKPQYVIEPPPTESKLEWAELKKIIEVVDGQAVDPTTGEMIPGITVIERDSKFNIKLVI